MAAALAGLGAVALWPGDGREGTQRPPTTGLPPLYPAGTEGAPTPEAAALGFAGVLGMPAQVVGVRLDEGVVDIRPAPASGPVTKVRVVRGDGGWFVEGARSALVALDEPADGATLRPPVRLRGRATGTVHARVGRVSASPGGSMTPTLPPEVTGGAGAEEAPFDVTVDFGVGRPGPVALVLYQLDPNGSGQVWTATVVRLVAEPAADAALVNPGEVVAWLGSRLVVVRPDGSVGRQLWELAKPPIGIPVTAPDRRTVFVDSADYGPTGDPCGQSIVRITRPVAGPEVLTAGRTPAIDRAGRRLAFVACDGLVHVRDLVTGAEHVVAAPEVGELPLVVHLLAWSPDGRQLAVQVRYEDGDEVVVLDAGAASLQEARKVVDGTALVLAGWAREGVAVGTEDGEVVAFAPDGGRRALFTGARLRARTVRLDPAGDAVALVDADGVLWVQPRTGGPRRLGGGYVNAGW